MNPSDVVATVERLTLLPANPSPTEWSGTSPQMQEVSLHKKFHYCHSTMQLTEKGNHCCNTMASLNQPGWYLREEVDRRFLQAVAFNGGPKRPSPPVEPFEAENKSVHRLGTCLARRPLLCRRAKRPRRGPSRWSDSIGTYENKPPQGR